MTTITTPACFVCGRTSDIELTDEQAAALRTRTPIQDVLPEMPRDEREVLITGTHPACWASVFGSDEDEEQLA